MRRYHGDQDWLRATIRTAHMHIGLKNGLKVISGKCVASLDMIKVQEVNVILKLR